MINRITNPNPRLASVAEPFRMEQYNPSPAISASASSSFSSILTSSTAMSTASSILTEPDDEPEYGTGKSRHQESQPPPPRSQPAIGRLNRTSSLQNLHTLNSGQTLIDALDDVSVMSEVSEELEDMDGVSSSPSFPTFFRVFHPFSPSSPVSSTGNESSITVPIGVGDIILVHSIHPNGWADGTLLPGGARGWLPTNYCEHYTHEAIMELLAALTQVWDLIDAVEENGTAPFCGDEYVRAMIGGVRVFLEKTDCLNRDSDLVVEHVGVRSSRKSLLSDLTAFVRLSKRVRTSVESGLQGDELPTMLDSLVLHAACVVTRAVGFLDIWQTGFANADAETEVEESGWSSVPATPASPDATFPRSFPSNGLSLLKRRFYSGRNRSRPQQPSRSDSSGEMRASAHLAVCHDSFLGCLGSFIGGHLQSRSPAELVSATEQSVAAGRQLIGVVEAISSLDGRRASPLEQACEVLDTKLVDLVQATKHLFTLASVSDAVLMPDYGRGLVAAATGCVRAAGEAVGKARSVVERLGDFDLENFPPSTAAPTIAGTPPLPTPVQPVATSPRILTTPLMPGGPSSDSPMLAPPKSLIKPLSMPAEEPPAFGSASRSGSFVERGPPNAPPLSSIPTRWKPHGSERPKTSERIEVFPLQTSRKEASETATRPAPVGLGISTAPGPQTSPTPPKTAGDEPSTPSSARQSYSHELVVDKNGQVLGGSLPALVERLTTHDATPDNSFVTAFFLTFRLFTTPSKLVDALIDRFKYIGESRERGLPVRLRVYNVFKNWLELYWQREADADALVPISQFALGPLIAAIPSAGRRLGELTMLQGQSTVETGALAPRLGAGLRRNTSAASVLSLPATPPPSLSRTQMAAIRSLRRDACAVIDIDALELARQLTLVASRLFNAICPKELIGSTWMRTPDRAPNVRAMTTLSNQITGLVSLSILNLEEPRRRANMIRHWIKVAQRCTELENYDSLLHIVCALSSIAITRLRRTWSMIPARVISKLDELKEVVSFEKNYASLRRRLVGRHPPCIPFLGMFLTDLTFVDAGNPSMRPLGDDQTGLTSPATVGTPTSPTGPSVNVVNFAKHSKTARLIRQLQDFQVSYPLAPVAELQNWLEEQFERFQADEQSWSLQALQARSVVLEPREKTVTSVDVSTADSEEPSQSISDATSRSLEFLGRHLGLSASSSN